MTDGAAIVSGEEMSYRFLQSDMWIPGGADSPVPTIWHSGAGPGTMSILAESIFTWRWW